MEHLERGYIWYIKSVIAQCLISEFTQYDMTIAVDMVLNPKTHPPNS